MRCNVLSIFAAANRALMPYYATAELTMSQATKKRFIAGAVCPKCATMDTVITYSLDNKNWRGCVNCDFN
ncbi:MAG: YheV family putative metal-binding protein, partial [Moraxellaceae bacterium]